MGNARPSPSSSFFLEVHPSTPSPVFSAAFHESPRARQWFSRCASKASNLFQISERHQASAVTSRTKKKTKNKLRSLVVNNVTPGSERTDSKFLHCINLSLLSNRAQQHVTIELSASYKTTKKKTFAFRIRPERTISVD